VHPCTPSATLRADLGPDVNFFCPATIRPATSWHSGPNSPYQGRKVKMAPMTSEVATLRALTYRISSTPTSQLPQHVPAIAASLANCRTLLSSTQASGAKATSSEASVAIHKYRTLLSTLLQDRTLQGRWCAIVLTKATIELGAWETLQKSLPWVRGLLGFLNKPDPPSSKKLCIITLTRIFLLTREYPTLIREITTPSLPAFVQACLQIANSKSVTPSLLETILQSFNELLPRHPTIFRSYLKQLHPICTITLLCTQRRLK
jgi:pre-rRNA-processing protein RIX1